MIDPFALKDCALIAIATGEKAHDLRELRDRLVTIPSSCIYYHFWGGLLRPRFDDPEYQNDFASWAFHSLRDVRLAERLAIIDPTDFKDIEDLRRELIEVIEERMDESELALWSMGRQPFYFMRSQIVVFDTGIRIDDPHRLREPIPRMSPSSVFYHFIDARRRTHRSRDDFSEWLLGFGDTYLDLARAIEAVDPYFITLTELRDEIESIFKKFEMKG